MQAFGNGFEVTIINPIIAVSTLTDTAIAGALQTAKGILAPLKDDNTENIIYLVSDGIETCDGNPASVAHNLNSEGISTAINIVGFDVDSETQKQLKDVTDKGASTYYAAQNAAELNDVFGKQKQQLLQHLSERKDCKVDNAVKNKDKKVSASVEKKYCIIEKAKSQRDAAFN